MTCKKLQLLATLPPESGPSRSRRRRPRPSISKSRPGERFQTPPEETATLPSHPPHLRAFTLIELLVVVAIITLLMAILLPALGRSRQRAQLVVCATNMRGLGAGAQNYQTEFSTVLPWEGYAEGDRPIRSVGFWGEPTSWFNAMPAYGGLPSFFDLLNLNNAHPGAMPRSGSHSIFVCPTAAPAQGAGPGDLVDDGYFDMFGQDAAGNSTREKTYWCYGFNTQLDNGIENRNTPPTYHVYISMPQIPSPPLTILLAEKIMRADELSPAYTSNVAQSIVSWREFTTRHNNGGNLLFLDNHVEWFSRPFVSNFSPTNDYNRSGAIIWNPGGAAN